MYIHATCTLSIASALALGIAPIEDVGAILLSSTADPYRAPTVLERTRVGKESGSTGPVPILNNKE